MTKIKCSFCGEIKEPVELFSPEGRDEHPTICRDCVKKGKMLLDSSKEKVVEFKKVD